MASPGYPPVQQQPGAYKDAAQMPGAPIQQQPGAYPAGTEPSAPQYAAPQAPGAYQGPGGQWMQPGAPPPGCPPGLEYLTTVDQLLVKQKVELLEDQCCCTCCMICCNPCKCFRKCQKQCCTNRSFDMTLFDNTREPVLKMHRPLRCATCWYPCCLQKLEVTTPPGAPIGTVRQKWSICGPEFAICDSSDAEVLTIEGPCCTWSCCGDVKFKVLAGNGQQVGEVSKQWSGLVKEYYTDADNFGITFPMDLDVKIKATILGACFLIDFMFFEDSPTEKRQDAPGMLG